MTEQSRIGIEELLSSFSTEELFSLATTVTQGLLKNKLTTREGALQVIINYSPDEISILRRKLVTRDVLFEYLHKKQIPVTLPITKNELIDKIANYWKLPAKLKRPEINSDSNGEDATTNYSLEGEEQAEENSFQSNGSDSLGSELVVQATSGNVYLLAQQFSQWFYMLMNQDACIGTEHFYPDARLKLNVFTNGNCNTEFVENSPEEIAQALFRTKSQFNLFFNPNISKEGVQGRTDPHGLVIVLACGTLHVNNTCAGVFEQVFAIARDPFAENNYKIKNTELNLKSKSGVNVPPSLCESELTSGLLALPS